MLSWGTSTRMMWAGELTVLIWGFSKCPRRVFPNQNQEDPWQDHPGSCRTVYRPQNWLQPAQRWPCSNQMCWAQTGKLIVGPCAFPCCEPGHLEDFKQKMWVIFGNSLFKEALPSRKSSKTSELGKRRLFWLKNEAQPRVKVGKLPERRKGKWIIMNINQPQAEGCQVKPVASRAEGNRDVLFRYKRLKVVV